MKISNKPNAIRHRRWRKRKREGIRCFRIELNIDDIGALERWGSRQHSWPQHDAVVGALYKFLDARLHQDAL